MTVTNWPAAQRLLNTGYRLISVSKDRDAIAYTLRPSRLVQALGGTHGKA